MSDRIEQERGAATILVLAIVAVSGILLFALTWLIQAQTLRQEAQAAADFAALAAGEVAQLGAIDPCATAVEAAKRNGAELRSCTMDGHGNADVVVRRKGRIGGLGTTAVEARARAGPQPHARGDPRERPFWNFRLHVWAETLSTHDREFLRKQS